MTGHRPQRPKWDCEACKQPYPCPDARTALAAGDPWTAATYLAGQFVTAVNDLPTVPVVDLYARFLLSVPVRSTTRPEGIPPSPRSLPPAGTAETSLHPIDTLFCGVGTTSRRGPRRRTGS
ncbi:hypothetical protein GCM10009848_14040 [Micromonospora lupini]